MKVPPTRGVPPPHRPSDGTGRPLERRCQPRQRAATGQRSADPRGFEAFFGDDRHCYLRHIGSNAVTVLHANPHRQLKRRNQLEAYLDVCSSDELIEEVLLPMFRQLGFHRVTAVGHKDKAIEYGKDG